MVAATVPLREALRREPGLLEARASLGLALYGMGDLDAAVEELGGLLRQHPDAVQARLTLATALVARQDWTAAQRELEEVVRQRPELVQAYYSLGVVHYSRGDLPGAIDAYRQVVARRPDHDDARYNLALMLKLAHRDAEATPEFLVAARAGLPRAQFFAGTAYAGGLGVERDLAQAIGWWSRAAEHGVIQAEDALAELRQIALGRTRHAPTEREAVQRAFRDYRMTLCQDLPDLERSGDDACGAVLLHAGRVGEAVEVLLREARALSEPAERRLETLYEQGVEGQWPAYDRRILSFFTAAAAEGQPRPRIALARFYAGGLGVPKDVGRAITLLQTTPHEDAQRLLQELSAARP
jgi:TPR repeat protein